MEIKSGADIYLAQTVLHKQYFIDNGFLNRRPIFSRWLAFNTSSFDVYLWPTRTVQHAVTIKGFIEGIWG